MIISAIVAIIILIVVPTGAAALFKRARCPGWAVVGGAVAGILLGPSILGRVLPDQYNELFIGAITQRADLDQLLSRQGADILAAKQAGAIGEQIDDIKIEHIKERTNLQAAWEQAKWDDQSALRYFAFAIVALTLLSAGSITKKDNAYQPNLVTSMSVGLWAASLPSGLAFGAMYFLWEQPLDQSLLVAGAMAIGPWMLTAIDREAADQAELGGASMMQSAGYIATIVAILLVACGLFAKFSTQGLIYVAPLLAMPLIWLTPKFSRLLKKAASNVFVPILSACVGLKIDIYDDFSFWPIAAILIIGGDIRWMGAYFGAMSLGGRSSLRTMRLVLGSMSCGTTQLAVATIAIHTWAIAGKYAFALLLSAILIEITVNARRSMAQRLIDTEESL